MAIAAVSKKLDHASQAAVDAFFSRRAPSGAFKKAGEVEVIPGKKRRGTRVRHDLRKYLEGRRESTSMVPEVTA